MTFAEFCQKHDITATVKRTPKNPHMQDSEKNMLNYLVTLHFSDGKMKVYFSTGKGWKSQPVASDVLSCLVFDAQTVKSRQSFEESFEEWCQELGYDSDSRKAEATYNIIKRQTARLVAFLGAAYAEARECEE